MKKITLLVVVTTLLCAFFSCKKNGSFPGPIITSFTPQQGGPGITVTIHGQNFDSVLNHISVGFNGATAVPIVANDTEILANVPVGATTGKITVTVNGRSVVTDSVFTILSGSWAQVAGNTTSPTSGRGGVATFVINGKGYFGFGDNDGTELADLWEFDPATNIWTQKTPCPIPFFHPFKMVLNGKAYIGTGITNTDTASTRKMFEYDPDTDKWNEKADFPGETNIGGTSIVIGNYGYAGLGMDATGINTGEPFAKSWWRYDATTDTWTQMHDFTGPGLEYAAAFTLNGKGYVGTSSYGQSETWWQYDPTTDTWAQKANYPGEEDFELQSFTIGNYGYVAQDGECWQYDPTADTWTQKSFFTNQSDQYGGAFAIGNYGYYVMGQVGAPYNNTWQFMP